MGNQNRKEVVVTKHGHSFRFIVVKSGAVECSIDDGKAFAVKRIQDGKAFFNKKQEVVVNGDTVEIGCIDLGTEGLAALTEAKNVRDDNSKAAKPKSAKTTGDKNCKVAKTVKPVLPARVDAWQRKIRTYKDKAKVKRKYCVHTFRIGNNSYSYLERDLPDVGIVINPNYKISDDVSSAGGFPRQYGELIFWDYWFEDEGWRRVRELNGNELICLGIIREYGYFASQSKE